METLSRSVVHFSRGVPPPEAVPSEELAEHASRILRSSPYIAFAYPPIGGYRGDEQLLLALAERHDADPDAIFIGNGSLQVLDLIAAHLVDRATTVLVERPTYDRALKLFARHGGEVVGISLEVDGIDVDAVRQELRRRPAALVYTIPDFQNPSGVTMSVEKRIALVRLAETYGVPIVEDSPYRSLRYRGSSPPALADLAAGSTGVISVNSLSKVLSPGLRVGYAVSDPSIARALAELAENTYLSPSPLAQAVAGRALTGGLLDANVERICELLKPRHDAAVAVVQATMPEGLMMVPNGGYFLGLEVRWADGEEALLGAAQADGVSLIRGSAFYPPRSRQPRGLVFLRLPFQALEPEVFAMGVERLAGLLA